MDVDDDDGDNDDDNVDEDDDDHDDGDARQKCDSDYQDYSKQSTGLSQSWMNHLQILFYLFGHFLPNRDNRSFR